MKIYWDELTDKRNRKLITSDWTQMPDAPLTDAKKTEWATYRQQLRDIPNNLRSHENYVSDDKSNPIDGTIMDWQFPNEPT